MKEYAISKYPNTLIGGVPYSMPYQQPAVNINHDEAIRLCESKGPGWHLITNDEWAALARQSCSNGTLPRGNTGNGKSHRRPEETGTTYKDGSCSNKTLTGSGPETWNHTHTAEGVADMCGNIWEYVGGIRFMDGQVQVIPDNGAAAGVDQSRDSKEWTPLYTADGNLIYYNVKDNEIRLQPMAPESKDFNGVSFTNLDASALDVPEKLIELGLYPAPDYKGSGCFWLDTDDERIVLRGGCCASGILADVFSLHGHSRAYSGWSVGFRSALVRYTDSSGDPNNPDDEATDLSDAPQETRDTIRANAERPMAENFLTGAKTPHGMLRLVLARQIATIYEAAHGRESRGNVIYTAYKATGEELRQTVETALSLARMNIAVETMKCGIEQAKLAATMTLTIGKEKGET